MQRILDPEPPTRRECPGCGYQLSGRGKFCPECGAVLGGSPDPTSEPAGAATVPPPATAPAARSGLPGWWANASNGAKVAVVGGGALLILMVVGAIGNASEEETTTSSAPATMRPATAFVTNNDPRTAVRVAPPPPAPAASTSGTLTPQQYRERTAALGGRYSETLQTITRLSSSPQFANTTWRTQFQTALDQLKAHSAEVQALRPPPCYAAVQEKLLASARSYTIAATQAELGLRTNEAQGFTAAARSLQEGAGFMNEATALVPRASC